MAGRAVRLCHLDDLPDGDSRGFDPFRAGHRHLLEIAAKGLHDHLLLGQGHQVGSAFRGELQRIAKVPFGSGDDLRGLVEPP